MSMKSIRSAVCRVSILVAAFGIVGAGVTVRAADPPLQDWRPNTDMNVAPAGLYKLDTRHAHLRFTAAHYGGISYPMFTFRGLESEYQWDPKRPEDTKVEARIRLTTLESGDKDFDVRMNQATYLYPSDYKPSHSFVPNPLDPRRITFVTTSIKFTEKNKGKMTGDMTFFGKTKPITLDFTYNGSLHSAEPGIAYTGYQKMGFSVQGSFKRSLFGMTTVPTAGDEVKFWMELEYHLLKAGTN